MSRKTQFRFLLPIVETLMAALVGGIGLWQRHHILSQRFVGDQTLWESTARFHVWPLPYRFAVITNIPAFFAASIVQWPMGWLVPELPEIFSFVLFVLFVPMLWFLVGSRFDRLPAASKRPWAILLSFTMLATAAMFTPGYVEYVLSGCVLWLVFGVVIGRIKPQACN
jgi:hypothetical protein